MKLLDKIGLGQKKFRDAPLMGKEKKKKDEASNLNNNKYLQVFIIVSFLVIVCFSVPRNFFNPVTNYTIGSPWKKEDLTAPFSFDILKSDKEIKREIKVARQNTPPIFVYKSDELSLAQHKLDSLFNRIYPVFIAYKNWKKAGTGDKAQTIQDSIQFKQAKSVSNVGFSNKMWLELFKKSNLFAISPAPKNYNAIGPELYQKLNGILEEVLHSGVINRPKNTLVHNKITVRNLQKHIEQTFAVANIRDLQEATAYAHNQLFQKYSDEIARAGLDLFRKIIISNFVYNSQLTEKRTQKAIANVSKTEGAITKGQVIIRKGDLITQQKYKELRSLAKARSLNSTHSEIWTKYAGGVLVILTILIIFFFYLYLYRKNIFSNNSNLLLVLLTIGAIVVASSLLFQLTNIPLYIIPVAIGPIVFTIIFDSRVGILATVTLALIVGFINNANFEFVTATLVACSLGLFSVRDIKNRSQFFLTTPLIVFLSYVAVIIGFSLASSQGWNHFLINLAYVAANAFFVSSSYLFILIFEKGFNITTDLTLVELSDTNLPILKKLMNEAPGTFHHSLQVSNLAEAAAGNIRANALLCRIGALYHDIGKLENPSYFAENQRERNEHKNLKPRMSALVIKAHVSNGVKIAKEYKLPDLIIDFIKTHHGTSVIQYFYNKAMEQSDPEKNEIQQEDFQYDGPLPDSKETGIVMLADCVEAASRAMQNPNYQKLEQLIDKLIDSRVRSGQLSQTPLTFRDLSAIKKTFLNILVGIYHSRVEYPDGDRKNERGEEKGHSHTVEKNKELTKTDKTTEKDSDKIKKPTRTYYNS